MGLQLPGELAAVAEKAGVRWPEADEDAMRRSAQAWREAGRKLESVTGDADGAAKDALSSVSGSAGDAARQHWDRFVEPDSGHLSNAVRGCTAAADRLDHAAAQVGAAKTEIVRQLVGLAKTEDAAQLVAASGDPSALATVDTATKGAAANVTHVTDTLTHAVRQDTGLDIGGMRPPVPDALAATGGAVYSTGHSLLGPATGADAGPGQHHGDAGPVGQPPGHAPGHHGPPAGWPDDPEHTGPVRIPGDPDPAVSNSDTGPIAIPGTPAAGQHGPAGQTVEQSSAAVLDRPRVQPGDPAPPVQPAQQVPGPPVQGGGFTGGPAAGPSAPVPGTSAGGGVPGPRPVDRGFGGVPGRGDVGGRGDVPRPDVPRADGGRVDAWRGGRPGAVYGADAGRAEAAALPGAASAGGATQRARSQAEASVIALFLVHMFPIGHLPVPANTPARQVPPPPTEFDYAAGLRFPPGDHPSGELVDDSWALASVRAQRSPLRLPAALPADHPEVAGLAESHDPIGGGNEREWDRRFLVRQANPDAGVCAEHSWPPGELCTEGGTDDGEPIVLEPGAELDRFGPPEGRVLAEARTPFAQRSLPPDHLTAGYHRYRVAEPLPVWRTVSAAWFAQPGGGVRYRTTYPVADLVALGYLSDITHEFASNEDGAKQDGGE
jgi:hypothetical protein